jgi:4-hydroxy-3-methylbut-2-en-1-yl diphosphate reductase
VVQECLDYFRERFQAEVEDRVVRREEVHFPLPRELRALAKSN